MISERQTYKHLVLVSDARASLQFLVICPDGLGRMFDVLADYMLNGRLVKGKKWLFR